MDINFQKLMIAKSNEGLEEYTNNISKYTPKAIEAAIAELQNRGRIFSTDEMDKIKMELEERKLSIQKQEENQDNGLFRKNWKKYIVTDINAPLYYSERVIYIFSILFSVLSGSILLAINIAKTKNKIATFFVLAFGILYTALELWLISSVINTNSRSSGLTLFINGIGGLVLDNLFWKKYIGNQTQYRAKPIWIPLIICVVITVLVILASIYGD